MVMICIHGPHVFKTNPGPISCGLEKIYLSAKNVLKIYKSNVWDWLEFIAEACVECE
jgi:hypothetical protein